jgi:hypothetical protein
MVEEKTNHSPFLILIRRNDTTRIILSLTQKRRNMKMKKKKTGRALGLWLSRRRLSFSTGRLLLVSK